MKKVIAVSGGIDSVTLLHIYRDDPDAIVAHFDHGIRPNSADDQAFVRKLAQSYGLPFETGNAHLGASASEAEARQARYAFLNSVCNRYGGRLYVAHHLDDVFESIAINCLRGTGWRGLAPFRNRAIERPLIAWRTSDIYRYAAKHQLRFRQDQTNTEEDYLRNRVRMALMYADENQKAQLSQLYNRQCEIAEEVEGIIDGYLADDEQHYSRTIIRQLDDALAVELLRDLLLRYQISQTRPQLKRAIAAIRSYLPNKQFPLGKDSYIRIAKYHFSIKKNAS